MTYRMDELPCGLLINNVAREAIELARKLDEPVEFDFNGVIVTALHDDEESAVVGRYNEAMRREADDRRARRSGRAGHRQLYAQQAARHLRGP